jgi:GTP-binding protein HflX
LKEIKIPKRTVDTGKSTEKAFLVSVESRRKGDGWQVEDSIEELARLAGTAGAVVVGRMVQRNTTPDKAHYLV